MELGLGAPLEGCKNNVCFLFAVLLNGRVIYANEFTIKTFELEMISIALTLIDKNALGSIV